MERVSTLIIGSGFGGAVMACRLAEKGDKVVVLERGRRWLPEDYPSVSQRDWLWDEDEPEQQNGWLDFRYFGDMSVALGAGGRRWLADLRQCQRGATAGSVRARLAGSDPLRHPA